VSQSGSPGHTPKMRTLRELPEPGALLFDLDGTLVDTVRLRIAAWQEALRRYGFTIDRERLSGYIGSDGRWLAREAARVAGREIDWAASDEIDRVSGAIFDEMNA
jgi:beta-phosphoglucomutase-like phosphatase (HAD superfamily)